LWALKPITSSNAHHLYIEKCKMYLYSLIGFRTLSILGPPTLAFVRKTRMAHFPSPWAPWIFPFQGGQQPMSTKLTLDKKKSLLSFLIRECYSFWGNLDWVSSPDWKQRVFERSAGSTLCRHCTYIRISWEWWWRLNLKQFLERLPVYKICSVWKIMV